jgi:hypothetical protein
LASTPSAQLVKLRSPFNGEVVTMEFGPGRTPTLEAMVAAGFTRVEPENPHARARKKPEDVDG